MMNLKLNVDIHSTYIQACFLYRPQKIPQINLPVLGASMVIIYDGRVKCK